MLWKVQSSPLAAYWLTGAGVVLPIMAPIFSKLLAEISSEEDPRLNAEAAALRKSLVKQWRAEINLRIGDPYPLPVPFAVTKQAGLMAGWESIRTDEKGAAIRIKGTFRDIAEMFARPGMPKRLVVLGEPGTGKSMIAQWLMLKLLEDDEDEDGQRKEYRVPFFLPLATWDPARPLDDWAAERMIDTYSRLGQTYVTESGRDHTLARELVAQRRVLMVLDGLDEMAEGPRIAALEKLSEAVLDDQCMVVTCRTEVYRKLVEKLKKPLAKTQVIELGALSMSAVRKYLKADGVSPGHWDPLLDHLREHPTGVLAASLATPLDVWLTRMIYGHAGTKSAIATTSTKSSATGNGNPSGSPAERFAELFKITEKERVRRHLLDGLVPAAYDPRVKDHPGRDASVGSKIHSQMVSLAVLTATLGKRKAQETGKAQETDDTQGTGKAQETDDTQGTGKAQETDKQQDIDWWRLHRMCPPVVIGLEIGLIVGPLLGVAAGLAVTAKAGHTAGLIMGLVFAVATGVLAGITCARDQPIPRAVQFSVTKERIKSLPYNALFGLAVGVSFGYADYRHGGLIAALIAAAVAGPTAGWAAIQAFEFQPGLTAGITAALAIGLAAGLASGHPAPPIAGTIAGLVFMVGSWIWIGAYAPADNDVAVNPQSLLRDDRRGCLVVGSTAGIAFGVIFGLALGLRVGIIAVVALTIVITLVVSLWGTFMVARLWLATRCGLPLHIMSFLHEAHDRGVLRQDGPHYRFRHLLLHEQLIKDYGPGADDEFAKALSEADGSPQPAPQGAVM